MKNTALITINAAIIVCCATRMSAELTPTQPVTITFGHVQTVFVKTRAASNAVEITKRAFLSRDFVVDATTWEKNGKIWCKRRTNDAYTDVFRERHVSVEKLQSMRSASVSELTNLLGEPVFMEGPIDFEGTVIYKWRTFNGERGDRFLALEAAAGFKGDAQTNVLFLLISVTNSK